MVARVTENSVEQRGFTGARLQAADFGEGRAIAQGAANLGRGLQEAQDNFAKIGEMHDDAVVKSADAEDLKAIMTLRAQALSSEGLEANGAIKDAQQKIEEIRRARMATFSNNRQRMMYDDVFKQRDLQITEQFSSHVVKQVQQAEKASAASRFDSNSDFAVGTYGTDAFDTNVATALGEIPNIYRGMPAEVISQKQAEAKSKILSRVIDGMLVSPDNVQEAQQALEQHAADILPDDETALRKKINPVLEEDQTEVDAGRAWSASLGPGEPKEATAPPAVSDKPESAPHKGWMPVAGRVTETAAGHRARGSSNALDIAAPEGSPIRPPMSGKVVKSYWTDKGGWQVLVEHPNGYVTGYAHLRSKSPLEVGEQVDNTTAIGSVGSTGHSSGPHVHFTARQSRGGPRVDPEVLDWGQNATNPKNVNWKEAPLQKYAPQENQLGRALDRIHTIATNENWSPRRYNRAVDRIRQQAGLQEQIFNQNSEARYNAAIEKIVELGDGLTSVTQVPGFADLKPGQKLSIQNIIKSNKASAGGGDEAGSPAFFRYANAAYDPAQREAFIRMDILRDPNLTNGERKQLFKMQWDIKNDQDGSLSGKLDEAGSAANRYMPKEDFKGDDGNLKRQKFMDAYMRQITNAQKGRNAPLTDREKDDIARALVVPIVRHGANGATKGLMFEYQGPGKERATVDFEKVYASIPVETHDIIRTRLAREGKSHSKQDIVRAYLEMAR